MDRARPGRPRELDHGEIISATLAPPPAKHGATHWSSRLLGKHLGISFSAATKAWREYGVQPWRAETFKFSTYPELVVKVTDVVGLYLDPPEKRHRVVRGRIIERQARGMARHFFGRFRLPLGRTLTHYVFALNCLKVDQQTTRKGLQPNETGERCLRAAAPLATCAQRLAQSAT